MEWEKAKKDVDERIVSKHIRALYHMQEKDIENDRLRHRLSELEDCQIKSDHCAVVETQVRSLQEELSNCSHLHALGKDANNKINQVKDEYRYMFDEYRQMMEKKYSQEVKWYKAERENLSKQWKEERERLKENEEELKSINKNLLKKLDAQEVMKNDVNRLNEELDKTVWSVEELRARNDELRKSEDSLKETCKRFEEENVSLREELDNTLDNKRKIKKDMNKMIMKITKYVKQIKELEKVKNSASRLEFENRWLKHLHEKSTGEIKALKVKHNDALNELQVVTEERNFMRNELASLKQETLRLKEEIESSKFSFAEFMEIKKRVPRLEKENRYLMKKSKTVNVKMLK